MVLRALLGLLLLLPAGAPAAPITPDLLRRHVDILASDAFEGRAPGSEGEKKTTDYIAGRLRAAGLEPAAPDGGWFQPVAIVTRTPLTQASEWRRSKARVALDQDALILIGARRSERVRRAPVVFAGHGAVIPARGVDQLAGADLAGAVVLILYQGPDVPGFPSYAERVKAVAARGAAAVIGIVGEDIAWPAVQRLYDGGQNRLEGSPAAPIQGAMTQAAIVRLAGIARTSLDKLLNEAPGPSFRPVRLKLQASLEVKTQIRRLVTSNVVGRLKGRGGGGEALLFLAHWDHLGICRAEGEPDRICNGAVDNASGVAALIEIARALAAGPRLSRDVLFLATTAEEMGLLGAEHFASHPPQPLASIVAAFNLDMVAIAPPGGAVAVMGDPPPGLLRLIEAAARGQGRALDEDEEADAFAERQDGWALARAGVPTVMVSGAYADMARLGAFLAGPYHQALDNPGPAVRLDGAAEDAELLVALAGKLADPAQYPGPQR
jgi:Zn-dependent M28 family amino/carboxypeptidase